MSKIVMISGSRSIQKLPLEAIASIDKIIELGFEIIVGDAPGVDSLVQQYLRYRNYEKVKVYYALFNGNGKPRNTTGYRTMGFFGNYSDRDIQMCFSCNYGLAIWDGRSQGTAANISRVLRTKVINC